jgi:hypothetical protein
MLCTVRLVHDLSPSLRRRMLGYGCSLVVMRNGALPRQRLREWRQSGQCKTRAKCLFKRSTELFTVFRKMNTILKNILNESCKPLWELQCSVFRVLEHGSFIAYEPCIRPYIRDSCGVQRHVKRDIVFAVNTLTWLPVWWLVFEKLDEVGLQLHVQ